MVPHPWPMASRAFTDILTTASSRFACGLTILAGVATWECEVMATGKYKGRQVSIDATQIKRLSCELGPAAIAKRLGIARSSVYRALA
jgi:hypothetical protein